MADQSVTLEALFPGSGEMSRLMQAHDWPTTPLGGVHDWPDGLKIPLNMLLTSRFEMWLGWGEDLNFFYNDAYIPTLGIKHPACLGRPFREVWAEVYDEVADQVAKVRAGEATWNDALLLLLERSGYREETYHSFSYSPLYGGGAAVEGMLCVVTEVTERVITERRLGSLRLLGMRLVGAASREEVADAARLVFGANRRDFPFALLFLGTGAEARGIACSEDAAPLLAHSWPTQGTQLDGRHIDLPRVLDCPSGDWDRPPAEALIVAIPGLAGQAPVGHLVLGLNPYRRRDDDLTDVVRLLAGQLSGALANVEALRAERRRADRIWSHSRDLLVTIAADGVFRSASPAWTRLLGHPLDQVVGHSFTEFVLPEDIDASAAALGKAAEGDDLTSFENRFLTADGRVRWFSWHTAVEDDLVFGYGRDITEQKANADALAHAEEALRQAQKMEAVGQLTGGIAHDFNNILTAIGDSVELMAKRLAQGRTEDLERLISLSTGAVRRAASLTQRLLAFSRRQTLDPRPVHLNALVNDMLDLIARSVGPQIDVRMVGAARLWTTFADVGQLESALLNLCINARDAMPNGGCLTIETSNREIDARAAQVKGLAPGQYVALSVSDTGSGMTAEVRERAFDPFFTTKPIGQGTGLGLSMVYGFAGQSGGTAQIHSAPGEGATISIYLPRHADEAPAAGEDTKAMEIIPAASAADTILVVDDEYIVRMLAVQQLTDQGYSVVEAADGASALEILGSGQPISLLVTDVGLPGGMNGRQLAETARLSRPDLKVLYITGYADDAVLNSGHLRAGMHMMTKPFDLDQFARRVGQIVSPLPA